MTKAAAPLILHVFPSFAVGGAQMRMIALANRFGQRFRHAIIALDHNTACATRLSPDLDVQLIPAPTMAPALLPRLNQIGALLRVIKPDILITSNWGAIEWAMARSLGRIARHIHTEDGFGPEEQQVQLRRRVLTRRIALRWSEVVVPSATLHMIGQRQWHLPSARLHFIPNGIDLAHFHPQSGPRPDQPGLKILCVAALRPEKNLQRLLRALHLTRLTPAPQLAIAGDGPERTALESLAAELGLNVRFLGNVADPAPLYRAADLFALSSDTEQMPLSVIEAMSCGLPVVATAVGDIQSMVAPQNQPLLSARSDQALAGAFSNTQSINLPAIGVANRLKAERLFDIATMTSRWQSLLDREARPTDLTPKIAGPK